MLPILLLLCLYTSESSDNITFAIPIQEKPLLWEPRTPAIEFDTMPPCPIWKMKCDGSTDRAMIYDMPDNANVRTNLDMIFMHNDSSFNYEFIYNSNDIIRCQTPSTEWGLKVKDLKSDARAVLEFRDCSGNDTIIEINYIAPKVIIKPKFSNFGIVKKGAEVFSDFWLINISFRDTAVVKRLELKDKDKGFTIPDIKLPIILLPMDSIQFKVYFTATEEGRFIDSIGFGNGCIYFNVAQVEAVVKQSIINVSDALFEDLPIKKIDTITVEIKNDGNVDLIITGYKGPTNPAYKTTLPEISAINTLTIKPDSPPYKFDVEFSPLLEQVYRDSIVFFSDADKIDSVAILNGNGIQPGMISTSFDWGRKRIGKEYSQSIVIENTSDGDVTIYGFAAKVNNGGSVFQFDKKLLDNVTIQSGKTIFIPVKFKPLNVGVYELVIIYDNSINSQTETRLSGIGVDPRLETQDVSFDTSVVGQKQYPIHDTIRFKNVDWEFADTIRINDLKILPNGDEISTDIEQYGKSGFKFDKKSLHLPRILLAGEVLEIPMMFVAQQVGDVNTSIKTISDIEPEDTANLHGFGINQGIKVEINIKPSICPGQQSTIIASVINTGNEMIDVKKIEIKPDGMPFYFENQTDRLGFYLDSGKTEKIKIIYKPDKPVFSLADLIVYNNTMFDGIKHNELAGNGFQKQRSIRVELVQENNLVQIGETFQSNIILEPGDNIDSLEIKQLSVEIRYNGGILKPFPEDIRLGELLEGRFQINNLKIIDNPGIISLTLDTLAGIPGQKLSGDGQLLKIIYHTYLPNSKDSSDKSIIDPIISAITTSCIDFSDTKKVTVQVDPVCMYDIRKIDIHSLNYGLGAINPNPVGTEGSEVFYSIGLEGTTQFEIINSQGNKIYSLSYQNQKPGVYTFNIPSGSLESGVYWFRMVSGPFSSIKEFIIIK